jgi:hypothetical protein
MRGRELDSSDSGWGKLQALVKLIINTRGLRIKREIS